MRALLVALVLLVAVGLNARPAQAHSDIEASSPAAGSTVTTAPAEVTITFGGAVRGRFSTVVVTGPDGVKYGTGEPRAVDKTLHQPVKPLVPGEYTVAWRVVSGDGHPLQGVFEFTADVPARTAVEPSAVEPSAIEPSPVAVEEKPASATEQSDGAIGTGVVVLGVLLVAVVAGVGVRIARRRRTS